MRVLSIGVIGFAVGWLLDNGGASALIIAAIGVAGLLIQKPARG